MASKRKERRGERGGGVVSANAKLIADRLEVINASIGELTDAVTALAVMLQGRPAAEELSAAARCPTWVDRCVVRDGVLLCDERQRSTVLRRL
jgi:hypothetical protein